VLANFLIGLREGLEAALVVGILVAYLVRTGNRHRLAPLWVGVGSAVGLSLVVGALLTFTSGLLPSFQAQEAFGGFMSLIAVAFVTWMVFWMRRTARHIKGELQGRLDVALSMGAGALVATAFIAVAREGLETALFVWSAVQAAAPAGGSTVQPIIGAILGLLTAVVLGWLVYKRSVNLNLATFFRFTGAALIVVAAGVAAYAIHDLQEAKILPGLNSLAFDVSATISPSSWVGTLLKGIFNFSPRTSWLEAIAWLSYVVPTMALFFRPQRSSGPSPAPASSDRRTPATAS
jgi:high-affinity iron transporter